MGLNRRRWRRRCAKHRLECTQAGVPPAPAPDSGPGGGSRAAWAGAGERSIPMSQIYWNEPSKGYVMSAEEFAAGAGQCSGAQPCQPQGAGCGCEGGERCPDDGCRQNGACCQQMICCCHSVPGPQPKPPQVEEGCCCKESFRTALGLLCDQQISSLLDFDAAAFITDTYVAGAALSCGEHSGHGPCREAEAEDEGRHRHPCPPCPCGASDNLGPLSGSFRRFALCNRDLLDIEAELHTAGRKDCDFIAAQVSLCKLGAVVIQGAKACAKSELPAGEAAAQDFRCLRQLLAQRLNPCGSGCGENWCSCACDERDCCCAAGLLDTLARNNLSRRVSLAAGLLLLQNVTLLGSVGNVLVLANDCDNRLYFVCVNSVQFIG